MINIALRISKSLIFCKGCPTIRTERHNDGKEYKNTHSFIVQLSRWVGQDSELIASSPSNRPYNTCGGGKLEENLSYVLG